MKVMLNGKELLVEIRNPDLINKKQEYYPLSWSFVSYLFNQSCLIVIQVIS
jgi:hypothetical protein